MAKGRTLYSLQYYVSVEAINGAIQQFLVENGFSYYEQGGINYYTSFDAAANEYRAFQYSINGPQVQIWANLGTAGNESDLDGQTNPLATQNYLAALNVLFDRLSQLQSQADQQNLAAGPIYRAAQPTVQEQKKKSQGFAIAGFIIAVVMFIASSISLAAGYTFTFGWVFYVAAIALNINGLKSRLKGLSIAGLVFAGLDIVFFFIMIALYIAYM